MTTPSDMKPSERIFAGNKSDGWSLADHRAALSVIAEILDEQHAAGQGEPDDGSSWCQCPGCGATWPEFLRQHTWISDPPTPATGGEGEAK